MKSDKIQQALNNSPLAIRQQWNSDREGVLQFLRENGLDVGNLYQEIEMTASYVDIHPDVTPPGTDMIVPLHSHLFYEIIYCCSSCGIEYLLGSSHYRLQKGDIVIIPPGVSHRPLIPEELTQPYLRYVLWLSQDFADYITHTFSSLFPEATVLRTFGSKWEFLGDIFAAGERESAERAPQWRMALAGTSIYLIAQLFRALQDHSMSSPAPETPDLFNQVMDYVEHHLTEKITIEDVAHAFYVSESTISQIFRKRMGVSFHRCVTQRKLIAAKEQITQGMPLEAVSEGLGFQNYSTFYRAFRQEYGISPRQFRQLLFPTPER